MGRKKKMRLVVVELRALMFAQGVLDCEFMQAKFISEFMQLFFGRAA